MTSFGIPCHNPFVCI